MEPSNHSPFDAEELRKSNTLGLKIAAARRSKKLTQRALAERFLEYDIAVNSGAVSKWEKGLTLPNPYQLLALCDILGIQDPLEYFTGTMREAEDFSPELSLKGLNLLQMFKEMLIASGNYQVKSRRADKPERKLIQVKVFRTPAAAGPGSFLDGEDYDMIEFDAANVPEDTDFGIRVTGDSMLPRYIPGQTVFVEQCSQLYDGEIGVFVYDDNAYIKQYCETMPSKDDMDEYTDSEGYVRPKIGLVSLNRDCADCDVDVRPERGLYIVGRVLN